MVMGRIVFLFLALNIFAIAECRTLKHGKEKRAFFPDDTEERREVCIEDMGCYPDTNPGVYEGWTWASMTQAMEDNLMRDSRKFISTQFRWWAPGAAEAKNFTNFDFEETFGEGFDAKLKVKFIIHGYNGGDAEWPLAMKNAFMRKEQCNVFIVDWSNGDGFMYATAVANTWVVGAEMGHFIIRLVEKFGVKLEDVHIIGHSLGAHTSGYAGKWVKNQLSNNTVGRITGLDPAGPEFYGEVPGERLDMGDASFVDIIHTNWAYYALAGLGLYDPVGHFDFYPNGGEEQPGCKTQTEVLISIDANAVDDFSCSHSRAFDLFTDSIESESCQFLADQCTSWADYEAGKCPPGEAGTLRVEMGYHADEYRQYIEATEHKSFFLSTNAEKPFCKA